MIKTVKAFSVTSTDQKLLNPFFINVQALPIVNKYTFHYFTTIYLKNIL